MKKLEEIAEEEIEKEKLGEKETKSSEKKYKEKNKKWIFSNHEYFNENGYIYEGPSFTI